MAAFPNLVLTNAGIALQNKVQGGATLELTNMQMGSGQLNGQPIGPLTALISSNATVPIQGGQAIGQNTYQVEGFFTNADLSAGFWWGEIGIFANDPDNGEILYAYANAGDAGDYIPTVTDQRIEKYIYFSMALANATTVNVTIPQTDTFVLKTEIGQPNGVAGLGENGAVPIAQGGTGATSAQDAVVALGALFAIAAAAAYDPEGSYAVGDYCTHGGKLHKCSTPIESGEEWNAAHWTATTVAAELAAVQAGLSKKLGLINGIYTDLSAMPERPHTYLTPTSEVVGLPDEWPQSRHDFVRLWCGNLDYTLDFIASYANKKLAYRLATGKWFQVATATPPQEYDLPLADGITAATAATYCKTQEGIVIVYLGLSGDIGNWTTLGTLPEGVRPARTVNLLGFLDAGSTSTRYPIVLLIDSDGTIRTSYLAEGKSGTKVYGTFVFLAAS